MTEEFLHYLWKFRNFHGHNLKTTSGESLQILNPGFRNGDAGPDFSNARIRIGDQLWAGNVEIHICSSDWFKHRHHLDRSYDSVVLHVVYEDDRKVINADGNTMPTLVLKGLFDEYEYWRYEQIVGTNTDIPCATALKGVDHIVKENMLERVLIERLQDKSEVMRHILEKNNFHWSESFYQCLCRGFGIRVNVEPMLMLARELPYKVLLRHREELFQLEALLFGVSGLNDAPRDKYARELHKEFCFLRKKYGLRSLDKSIWKFSRLRPPSFPTLRLAQWAGLINKTEDLLHIVIETSDKKLLMQGLRAETSDYWSTHFRFNVRTRKGIPVMGPEFAERLIINVIIPFLFLYGQQKDQLTYRQRALDLLEQLPAENNRLTRLYGKFGFNIGSVFHSQAVLQLHKYYCEPKKCLNCAIGIRLLKNNDR